MFDQYIINIFFQLRYFNPRNYNNKKLTKNINYIEVIIKLIIIKINVTKIQLKLKNKENIESIN